MNTGCSDLQPQRKISKNLRRSNIFRVELKSLLFYCTEFYFKTSVYYHYIILCFEELFKWTYSVKGSANVNYIAHKHKFSHRLHVPSSTSYCARVVCVSFMTYLRTEFHMPTYSSSLVTAITPRPQENFPMTTKKYYLNRNWIFSHTSLQGHKVRITSVGPTSEVCAAVS